MPLRCARRDEDEFYARADTDAKDDATQDDADDAAS